MTKCSRAPLTRENISNHISCVAVHHAKKYAVRTAALIGKQWNHKERGVQRNIRSMLEESKDSLPCHLALLLNVQGSKLLDPGEETPDGVLNGEEVVENGDGEDGTNMKKDQRAGQKNENRDQGEGHKNEKRDQKEGHENEKKALSVGQGNSNGMDGEEEEIIEDGKLDEDDENSNGKQRVIGHLKLVRAASRGDGSACIMYSLVVDEQFRGLGLGRLLTGEGEKYARELNISYMYLFTEDKVPFYEHIGYKQCEPLSSLGENAKRLNVKQLSALEGLFAKRQNVESSSGHTWLRKRLMLEYHYRDPLDLTTTTKVIATGVGNFRYYSKEDEKPQKYIGFVKRIQWQQQTGPSCGISALNMLKTCLDDQKQCNGSFVPNNGLPKSYCNCACKSKTVDVETAYDSMLDFALNSGVSNDGEMFCAYNLAMMSLAYQYLKLNVQDIVHSNPECKSESHPSDDVNSSTTADAPNTLVNGLDTRSVLPQKIVQSVCKGLPVLIPYDKSNKYTPCRLEGLHAHWALITGIILPRKYESGFKCKNLESSTQSLSTDSDIEIHDLAESVELLDVAGEHFRHLSHDLLLVCMHGMSEKSFVCSYKDMIASNGQLRTTKSKFFLASDGLVHLRNKIIFVD